ncbi:hypothetical protein Y5W_02924 [Alcanivorax sp. 521-1]|uniref:DUF106 domain-containing protein n=1 Tax=Alloalcanivorax profundimaris TaxID=2735259 RepID=A0ABS0AUH2_9GAMM|nr:hypothetical protein [Alloalcanivorax profundimaris]MBF5057630.1 hypothetical protein [Alloalcanivorax profundimaris]
MDEFIRLLAAGLQKGNVLLVIIVLVVLFVLNAHKLYPLFVERKKSRLKSLEAALQSEWVKGAERECLKKQAETEHFHAATGIMLEKAPREALLRIYERSGGRLSFVHFKRALPFVHYQKGEFEIRLGWFDRWMMRAGIGTGLVFVPLSMAVLVWALYAWLAPDSAPFGSWKVWVFLNLGGWASVLSSRSAYSANRVRREIQRQASETNIPDDATNPPANP